MNLMAKYSNVSIIQRLLAYAILLLSYSLIGAYYGFTLGARLAGVEYEIDGVWWSHTDPYTIFSRYQCLVSIFLFFYLGLKLLEKTTILRSILSIASLAAAGLYVFRLVAFKSTMWNDGYAYLSLGQKLYYFDIFAGGVIVILIVLEVISIERHVQKRNEGNRI